MKRQSLYIGGALLATTALSTAAMAGTIVSKVATNTVPGTVLGANNVAVQVFGSTVGATVTMGGTVGWTVNFSNSLTSQFNVELESTNSDFTGTVEAVAQQFSSAGTFIAHTSTSGCAVQVLTERILVDDCSGSNAAVEGMNFSGVTFNNIAAMATAGNSLVVNGIVRGQSNNTFELISDGTITTAVNGGSVVSAGTGATVINNNATPPFSGLGAANSTTEATTLVLGTVRTTLAGAFAADLSTAITSAGLIGGTELTVTHGVLTDDATTRVDIQTTGTGSVVASATTTAFNGSAASFDIGTASTLTSFDIEVNFDGTTAISAWSAGTVGVSFTTGTQSSTALGGATGTLGSLVRGGFATQINTAQSSAGTGATLFQSLVRITNNGSVDGAVSITVRDDTDGSVYGTYTTDVIEANSSIQVSMPTIENALSITPADQYNLAIAGPIDGYAQHVMFNEVDSLFVDLSGFRNAAP